jgi:hypothetical protein
MPISPASGFTSIARIADLLHRQAAKWKAIAVIHNFRAYFDDSGTHKESAVSALGGYVGSREAWLAIEQPWADILAEYWDKGVRWFHMADCLAQEDQFARIDKPSVNYIITRLSKILGAQLGLQPMFSAVVQDDWDVVTDAAFLKRFPNPIDLCFDDLVRSLAEWSAKNASGELVAPLFAVGDYGRHGKLYEAEPWYRNTLGTLGFDYPSRVIPLQAADLLANQIRFDIEKRANLTVTGPTNALNWATGGRFVMGHWFDAETLDLAVRRFNETGAIWPFAVAKYA